MKIKNILLILFIACPLLAKAYFSYEGLWYYITGENTVMLVKNTARITEMPALLPDPESYHGDIVIPEKVTYNDKEYTVTSIGEHVFVGNKGITSVTIPESVTSIGYGAFSGCKGITSLKIPNAVTRIGLFAFSGCSGLTSINMPSEIKSIEEEAFQGCTGLETVYVEDLNIWLGINFNKVVNPLNYAKKLCVNGEVIENLVIPEGTDTIRPFAFDGYRGLKSVVIPQSVKVISGCSFRGCSNLSSVEISEGVNRIDNQVFENCDSLESLVIPNSVKKIYLYVVSGKKIKTIICHSETEPLIACGDVIQTDLYDKVVLQVHSSLLEQFKNDRFWGRFKYITDIEKKIDYTVNYFVDNEPYKSVKHKYEDSVVPEAFPIKKGMTFSGWSDIPEEMPAHDVDITGSFSWSKDTIDSVIYQVTDTVLNRAKVIGNYNLDKKIKVVPSIELDYTYNVTSIEDNTFNSCKDVTDIEIGNNIAYIGERAFAGITMIENVTCLAENIPETHRTAFENSYINYATLHVPYDAVAKYKEAIPWKDFKEIVAIEELSYKDIDNVEVDGIYYNLKSDGTACVISRPDKYKGDIVIPEDVIYKEKTYIVTTIKGGENEGAFYNCKDMTTISIPKSIKTIGLGAFEHCSGLNAVYITDLISWLDIDFEVRLSTGSENFLSNPLCNAKFLYLNGERIQDLVIPESVTYVKRGAFCGGSFKTITFHKNVVGIGAFGFYGCKDLEDVYSYSPKIDLEGNRLALHPQDVQNATLHIRERFLENYYTLTSSWKYFKNIVYVSGYDYKLQYIVDDVVYKEYIKEVGEEIIPEAEPTKNGYTFSGWNDLPATMPDHDVIVMGTFIPNIYKLTYIVDEKEYKVCELKCDSIITPEPNPTRKGMTFSGWSEIPEKMPAKNVTVTGTFSWTRLTKDKVIYEVSDTLANYCKVVGNDNAGGEIKIGSVEIDACYYLPTEVADKAFYGCKDITKIEIPKTVGTIGERAFANIDKLTDVTIWAGEVPTTDRTAFENSYIEDYVTLHVPGSAIKKYQETAPWKNFKEIVAIEGTQRSYILTYMVDGEVYKTYEIKEGETITPEAEPTKEGYTFSGWSEIPERMPAKDVTVTGTFTQDVYEEGGNSYTIDENGATIVKGEDKEGEVLINATITIKGKSYQVIVIGEGAYKGCSKMSAVVIPDAIKMIGVSAFEGCSRLRSINIGKGVMAIDHKAFANIGSRASAVGTRAGEAGLKVSCSAETVPTTDDDVFENTDIANATLVVNDNLVNDYKSAIPWNGFGTIMGFEEASGIGVLMSEPQGAEIYSIDGRRLSKVQKGLNVVRTKDGVKKVVGK